jgi:hypothetical protein
MVWDGNGPTTRPVAWVPANHEDTPDGIAESMGEATAFGTDDVHGYIEFGRLATAFGLGLLAGAILIITIFTGATNGR